jgi:hypothetical protein
MPKEDSEFLRNLAVLQVVPGSRGNLYAESDNHDLKCILFDTDPDTAMNTFLEMLDAKTWPRADSVAYPELWAEAIFIDENGKGVWVSGAENQWMVGFGA